MEEKVEVETPSGKMEITLAGPLSIKQRNAINCLLGGGKEHKLDSKGNMAEMGVTMENACEASIKLVEFCVRSPEAAKKRDFLDSISEHEFPKLVSAANHVTAKDPKDLEVREKKSESPSSAV